MKEITRRRIFRTIHIFFSIPIIGYIYSPFDQVHFRLAISLFPFLCSLGSGCGRDTSFVGSFRAVRLNKEPQVTK